MKLLVHGVNGIGASRAIALILSLAPLKHLCYTTGIRHYEHHYQSACATGLHMGEWVSFALTSAVMRGFQSGTAEGDGNRREDATVKKRRQGKLRMHVGFWQLLFKSGFGTHLACCCVSIEKGLSWTWTLCIGSFWPIDENALPTLRFIWAWCLTVSLFTISDLIFHVAVIHLPKICYHLRSSDHNPGIIIHFYLPISFNSFIHPYRYLHSRKQNDIYLLQQPKAYFPRLGRCQYWMALYWHRSNDNHQNLEWRFVFCRTIISNLL